MNATATTATSTAPFATIVTASMGSCECGDCFCDLFSDGSIQYRGEYPWQQSPRRPFMGDAEPRRPYGSNLSPAVHKKEIENFFDDTPQEKMHEFLVGCDECPF